MCNKYPGCRERADGHHPDNHPVCPGCGNDDGSQIRVYYTGPLSFVCRSCGRQWNGEPMKVRYSDFFTSLKR